MEKVLRNLIYTVFILFIRRTLKFSRHRLENLWDCYRGHIMQCCCRVLRLLQLFASKYKLYLPTEEELKAEIETQKAMFYLQQQDDEKQ